MAATPEHCNSELELVRAACAGELKAFDELYHRCAPQLWRIAKKSVSRMGRPDLVDDLYQELWIRMLEALPGWNPTGELLHFVSHVASRKAIDFFRSNLASLRIESLDDRERLVASAEFQPNELQFAIDRCLKLLRPKHAETIRLLGLAGLTTAEAAEIFGVQENTVNQWTFRARKKLRECLDGRDIQSTRTHRRVE